MYRVELKAVPVPRFKNHLHPVPNVPCGVESIEDHLQFSAGELFLMYRVELKDFKDIGHIVAHVLFLMYRVELKGRLG